LGYLICRRCGARIDLPHVKYAHQVPPFFAATCSKCGRTSTYAYVDLRDVKFTTMEELLQRPEGRLPLLIRLLPDLTMYMYGIKQVQEGIAYALKRIQEEMERRRLQPEPPETAHNS
jgi:hypothetical protein